MRIRIFTLFFFFVALVDTVFCQRISDIQPGALQDSILWDSIRHWFGEDHNVTLNYLNLGIKQYHESGNTHRLVDCKLGKVNIYFQQAKFKRCNEIIEETKTEVIQSIGKNSETFRNVLFAENSLLEGIGDYKSAIIGYENILKEIPTTNKDEIVGYLQSLGRVKKKKGDFQGALNYLEKVARLSKYKKNVTKNNEIDYLSFANQINIADIHISLNQVDTAIVILNKAKLTLEKISKNKKGQAHLYLNSAKKVLAQAYLKKGDFSQATNQLNSIIRSSLSQKTKVSSGIYSLSGDAQFAQGNFEKAIDYYESALNKNLQSLEGFTRYINLATNYYDLAKTFFAMDSIDLSLSVLQKAIYHTTNEFQANQLYQLPELNDFNLNRNALALLHLKAVVHQTKYQSNRGTTKDLEIALKACYLEHEVLRKLYQQFQAEGSRFDLYNDAQATYELGIELAHTLYKKSKDKEYLFKAWQMAEYSKAIVLRESFNENIVAGMGQVPDSLLKKERKLNLQKIHSTKIISRLIRSSDAKDQVAINEQKEKDFSIDRQVQKLKKRIQQSYPQYYNYKYDISVAEIEDLKKYLNERNASLLEYFVGKKKFYLFHIDQKGIQIHDFELSDFPVESIEKLRSLLSRPPKTDSFDEQARQFQKHAHLLYQQLVAPAISSHIPNKAIIIVPDGIINYIPFELLLSKETDDKYVGYSTTKMHYFLEDFSISYASSATHLIKSNNYQKEKAANFFIGFAPSFGGHESALRSDCTTGQTLSKLHCNIDEVKNINAIAHGNYYLAEQANKSVFLDKAADHRIIHLATHACVDPANPKFNKIYFTNDELTHFDLQDLKLNAEMVVLSACNTGMGKLQIGEGLMSLSRSFQIAGCESSLMSLWPVDDCITSDLMVYFYSYLQKGYNKDIALRTAKLDYLKSADISGSHPYYWGAFTIFGNTDQIESFPSDFSLFLKWGILVFLAISSAVFLLIIKEKRRRNKPIP